MGTRLSRNPSPAAQEVRPSLTPLDDGFGAQTRRYAPPFFRVSRQATRGHGYAARHWPSPRASPRRIIRIGVNPS